MKTIVPEHGVDKGYHLERYLLLRGALHLLPLEGDQVGPTIDSYGEAVDEVPCNSQT